MYYCGLVFIFMQPGTSDGSLLVVPSLKTGKKSASTELKTTDIQGPTNQTLIFL